MRDRADVASADKFGCHIYRMVPKPTLSPFPSTHWTQVTQAGADGTQRLRVLGQLLERYRPAMASYLTARFQVSPDQAEDLLQGFLADKVIEGDIVRRADRSRGTFRSFLVTALRHYAVSRLRADRAAKRSPDGGLAPLDEDLLAERAAPVVADPFDVAWARQVVDRAVQRMREECDASGRADVWGVFEGRVLLPAMHQAPPGALTDVVRRLGVTPAQASNLLVTSKRMFARCLRAVVCEHAAGECDAEDEIGRLRRVLSYPGNS